MHPSFYFFLIVFFVFTGCSSTNFLSNQELTKIKSVSAEKPNYIFYEETLIPQPDGTVEHQTQYILQMPADPSKIPTSIRAIDGSYIPLKTFKVRIVRNGSPLKTLSDYMKSSTSVSNKMQTSQMKFQNIYIGEDVKPGDWVEVLMVHKNLLPGLGFSLDSRDLGENWQVASIKVITKHLPDPIFWTKNIPDSMSIQPEKSIINDQTITRLTLNNIPIKKGKYPFAAKNSRPVIYVQLPVKWNGAVKTISNWTEFGDWYLEQISDRLKPSGLARQISDSIIFSEMTRSQSLDQVFGYCSKQIRYEQVYLSSGEFVPNPFESIISSQYGDCKDYSLAAYQLAGAANIPVHLALCYRGRGIQFYDDVPVSQFNHMIVNYTQNDSIQWFDGTNRVTPGGLLTTDLINQKALILKPGESHILPISASPNNKLEIVSDMAINGQDLTGSIKIELSDQFATDFSILAFYLNDHDLNEGFGRWIRETLNPNLIVTNLQWNSTKDQSFSLSFDASVPNVIIHNQGSLYFQFSRIFPELLPKMAELKESEPVFYYPSYYHWDTLVNVKINGEEIFSRSYQFSMNPGPLEKSGASSFRTIFNQQLQQLQKTETIELRGPQ